MDSARKKLTSIPIQAPTRTNDGTIVKKSLSDNISNAVENTFSIPQILASQEGIIVTVRTQNSDEALEASEVLINYGALNLSDLV